MKCVRIQACISKYMLYLLSGFFEELPNDGEETIQQNYAKCHFWFGIKSALRKWGYIVIILPPCMVIFVCSYLSVRDSSIHCHKILRYQQDMWLWNIFANSSILLISKRLTKLKLNEIIHTLLNAMFYKIRASQRSLGENVFLFVQQIHQEVKQIKSISLPSESCLQIQFMGQFLFNTVPRNVFILSSDTSHLVEQGCHGHSSGRIHQAGDYLLDSGSDYREEKSI